MCVLLPQSEIHTGDSCLHQGEALSVLILSVDTDHVLNCGLQTFNSDLCLIWQGKNNISLSAAAQSCGELASKHSWMKDLY